LLFLKALRALALATALAPIGGCAIGLGLVFQSLVRGAAYSPDAEDQLFGHAMLGFALIESFLVIVVGIIVVVFVV
jgi:F0F1-type ATP synthase membrane subunit c/vacuolar-type H+-ATPase subunit K